MIDSVSPSDARRLVFARQGLASRRTFGSGLGATQKAIEHLGYVQIDTLSVVARAHIHTLWNRVSAFKATDIDLLQEQGAVFEHWAHALAILPMRDYRYSLPMMQRIASGDTHWYPKDHNQATKVLKRIREEGPLSAKDFKDKKAGDAMWARSPSKMALEQLFMEGELMVPRRNNFHEVYDLRERVLPSDIDVSTPTIEELCGHLIGSYLRAQGLAQIAELTYLRKGLGKKMSQTVADFVEEGMLQELEINGQIYYATPKSLEVIDHRTASPKLRILSPFDNSVIQRKRLASLFEFDYQIECYVPKAKRKYGYFCLPILRGNRFVARLDAKADRKTGVFHVMSLYLEKNVKNKDVFLTALIAELQRFAKFDSCTTVEIHAIQQME